VTARWSELDDPFFAEWQARRPGQRRSLARAAAIARHLGALPQRVPVLAVVGSKGKGTTALAASAALAGAGLRVVTVTSPALVTNHERIRIDGRAIDDATLDHLGVRLAVARAAVPSDGGYLSPTGAYTIAGHALAAGLAGAPVDVVVHEEGLGGASDEVSLFSPTIVAVTAVFAEHTDLLGPTVRDVARDLLGVVTDETRSIVTVPQAPAVMAEILAAHRLADVTVIAPVGGFVATNVALGVAAATAFAGERRLAAPGVAATVATLRLPGRMSVHRSHGGAVVAVDGAISPDGIVAAMRAAPDLLGGPPTSIVCCFPDGKDVAGCLAAVGASADGAEVHSVSAGLAYLRFDAQPGPLPAALDVLALLDRPGARIMALGTISFVGELLGALDVDCRTAFTPPSAAN
jgi:folylpolyglutamate synthase/dihydropteroate synthase